jgi:geranylgeranyl diphosphate synthase, type I
MGSGGFGVVLAPEFPLGALSYVLFRDAGTGRKPSATGDLVVTTAAQQVSALQQRYRDDVQAALHRALVDSDSGFFSLLRYHLGWEDADGRPANVITGKGLRPILCLTACEVAGGDWQDALPAAAALELVHNFSLIHDDIQDRDDRRWGRPTLWTVHGEAKAIAAGNAMRVIADHTLMSLVSAGMPIDLVNDVSVELTGRYLEMIEGQYMDMTFEGSDDVTVEQYLDMVGRKTGALIESAMYMGAMVATSDRDQARAFGACGRRLGLAFQIRDDFLGIWGDPASTGKAVGADIRRKKKSMPVVHLFEHASGADRAWLDQAYATEGEIGGEDVEHVLELLDRLGTPTHVQGAAVAEADRAMAAVDSLGLTGNARETVQAMAEFFVTREK